MVLRLIGVAVGGIGLAVVVIGVHLSPDQGSTDMMGLAALVALVVAAFGALMVGAGILVYLQGRRRIPDR